MSKYKVSVSLNLKHAVPAYLNERRKELPDLRSYYVTEDRASLINTAHKYASTGRSYGIDRISELGTRIETLANAGDAGGVSKAIAELKDYLENLEVIYV